MSAQLSDSETILHQSAISYIQRLVVGAFVTVWGLISIVYCVEFLRGDIESWLNSPAIAIPLFVGLSANLIWPIFLWFLLFPLRVKLNQFGIFYKNAGFSKQLSWDQVINVNCRLVAGGRYRNDGKLVVIKGMPQDILIPPFLSVSQDELLVMIGRYLERAGRTNIMINDSPIGSDLPDRRAFSAIRNNKTISSIYTFIFIIVIVFFVAAMGLIWWSLRLVRSA